MKLVTCLLAAACLFACSPPKYTYYFDYVKNSSPVRQAPQTMKAELQAEPGMLTASADPVTPGISTSAEGSAGEPHLRPAPAPSPQAHTRSARKQERKEAKALIRELRAGTRETIAAEGLSTDKARQDKSKNGFAIAGFILSIVSWIVLWPLAILGVIFSAIGMKSERKGLAIAGLIIGIVGIVVILAAMAASNDI